ncbi:hypothetical protein [Tardiphaga sp. 11_C7_N12_6]|uniref:hypothetical protein n=1 Tax=Tardiphaga sp. 11_C7_N12_6 TaxID=3240789 RepID=UPI003F24424E
MIPLFGAAMLIVFGGVIFLISLARTRSEIFAAGIFGLCALYLMVNPTKSSYSMAPTMALCAIIAILTPFMFAASSLWRRCILAAVIALMLGALVSLRIPNLLLVIGYAGALAFQFVRHPSGHHFLQGLTFAVSYLIGLGPTLWANYVNAGSILATTYGPTDVVPADFTFSIVGQYLFDIQGALCALAIAAACWIAAKTPAKMPTLVVGINLATNLLYFFSHPVYTQYYIMPVLTLSLWTLLAHYLVAPKLRVTDRDAARSAGTRRRDPAFALSG